MTPYNNNNQTTSNNNSTSLDAAASTNNDSSSSSESANTLARQVSMALETVQRLGINLLAIDFDQTLINVHTGGQWKSSARELARHVRPEFQELFHQVHQLENLDICIVTFSPQVQLIRHVLEEGTMWNLDVVNDTTGDNSHATNHNSNNNRMPLVIRGGDRSWFYQGAGSQDGKQPHMASAVEELESEHGRTITKQTTLLIDDDVKNVRCALQNGVRAIWFNPRRPKDLLPDMIRLI